jgi:glycosyltransferase involved in cell wall biosynthesis
MKILMTVDTVGGVWTYALQLARALAPAGVHVELATMGAPLSDAQRDQVRGCTNVTVHESRFRLEWMPDAAADVARAGDWLLALARTTRPDAVHLNGYAHAALPWPAPTLVVAHSCVLSWWRAVHGCAAPQEWSWYRTTVERGLARAHAVVAPTHAFLGQLRAHYDFASPASVIPNGCEPEPPHGPGPSPGRPDRPARWTRPVIFAAGRLWDEAKNMTTLAAAARAIERPVHVAGSPLHPTGEHRALPGLVALGVLTPATLRRWYGRAALFVHPAVYEPFGLAPLEAALAGCALVLGDIPTLREVWGDAAVYVPPRDPAAIASAVNALSGDGAALATRARAARRRARRYPARRMAAAYVEAYRSLQSGAVVADAEGMTCAS